MSRSLTIAQINAQLLEKYEGYTLEEIHSLKDYSFKWFKPINILLRNGYDVLTEYFEKNSMGRGITNFRNFLNMKLPSSKEEVIVKRPDKIPEAITNVQTRIDYIDSAFLNAKTKKTKGKMTVYRGKKGNYYDVSHSIDTGSPSKRNIDTGYISTTKSIESALKFVNNDTRDEEYKKTKQHCCLYRMHIMEGIPYIDMNPLSEYKESEILLPRDLKITIIESNDESIESDDESDDESIESDEYLTDESDDKKSSKNYNHVKIIDVKVEKSTENQFDKKPKNNIVTEPVGGNRRIKRRTNKLKNTHKRRTTKRRITKRRITKRRITKRRTKKRTLKY